jgi:acetyl-CoA/propionyl-CoA carboxylase biotin carboxyl carrier protein
MNTRLQVEHPVTELVTSTDLVRLQIEIARGSSVPERAPEARGHAVECRVYAEDPANGFLPTGGKVLRVEHPTGVGVRVDSSLFDGLDVPVEYDPLLAKVVAWGPDREQAVARAAAAAAAALIASRSGAAARTAAGAAPRMSGPWETLGGWRAGGGRP